VQCGQASARGVDLCAPCAADLPWNTACCARCGLPLSHVEPLCGRCLKVLPEFDRALCAFRYEWPLDALTTRFKFSADLAAGRVLSGALAQYLEESTLEECAHSTALGAPQWMIPVPLHSDRLRTRGFNQALELARPLSRALGIPLLPQGLRRLRATPPQTGLNALHRRRNVRGAFVAAADVRDRHIALIDDVITTAATVRECAKVLKRAGAASVQVWALARAGLGKGNAGAAVEHVATLK
jgi:ComF family protein